MTDIDYKGSDSWYKMEHPPAPYLPEVSDLSYTPEYREDTRYTKEPVYRERSTLRGTLLALADSSSLHGISKVASSHQLAVKILWSLLFLFTLTVFMIQIISLFK